MACRHRWESIKEPERKCVLCGRDAKANFEEATAARGTMFYDMAHPEEKR